jgi:hypothetical protein
MPATKYGIFHNLMESKYVVSNTEITFYFSSRVYMERFLERYKEKRVRTARRMQVLFNTDTVADIELYLEIEKRGFFVRLKRAKISKEELYKYSLRKMMEKDSLEWVKLNG